MGMAAKVEQVSDYNDDQNGTQQAAGACRALLSTVIMTVAASDPHTGTEVGDADPCLTPSQRCIMKEAV